MIEEKFKQERKQAKKLQEIQKEQIAERNLQSKKSIEAWKTQKDEKIFTKGLYTYSKKQEAIHDRSWCPARSLHIYSKNSHEDHKPRAKHGEDLEGEEEFSYSLSFEESGASSSDEGSSSAGLAGSVSRTVSPSEGRHKTIHVCCQTLHYWCTCDHHNSVD